MESLDILKYAFNDFLPLYFMLGLSFATRSVMSLCSTTSRRMASKRLTVLFSIILTIAGAMMSVAVLALLGLSEFFYGQMTLSYLIAYVVSCLFQGTLLHFIAGGEISLTIFNVQIQISLCLFFDVVVFFFVKFALGSNLLALFFIKFGLLFALSVLEYFYIRPAFNRLDKLSRSNRVLMIAFPMVSIVAMLLVSVYPIPYTNGFLDSELLDIDTLGQLVVFLLFTAASMLSYINFFRVVSSSVKEREEQRALALERERNKYFEQQSEMAKSNMELVKKQIHDLRHHNMVIMGYLQNNDIVGVRKYLSNYDKELESDIMTNYCINAAVNNILIASTKIAIEDGIDTIVETAVPASCKVDDSELVVVFANIYENAIEACRRMPTKSKKWIKLICKNNGGKLLIETENSCNAGVVFGDDEMPKSCKTRGGGQGTHSVARVVRKYGGICSFSENKGVFKFRAIFPI